MQDHLLDASVKRRNVCWQPRAFARLFACAHEASRAETAANDVVHLRTQCTRRRLSDPAGGRRSTAVATIAVCDHGHPPRIAADSRFNEPRAALLPTCAVSDIVLCGAAASWLVLLLP